MNYSNLPNINSQIRWSYTDPVSIGYFCDMSRNGKYGITEFSYAIIDDVENLEIIKKAMLNQEFLDLMSMTDGVTGVGRHRYNRKAISTFRKDFWKEFLD